MLIAKGRKPEHGSANHKTALCFYNAMKSNYQIALEVLQGKWGNGTDRKNRLTQAGYNFEAVQTIVNALVKDGYIPPTAEDEPKQKILEIDYDPEKYEAIQINIIV